MHLLKRRGLYEAGRIVYLPVDDIAPNQDQPRKNFDPESLRELASSIARYGILQPLSVRKRGSGYELVSGERRLRAARLVGLREVPCVVLDVDAKKSAVLALVENLQRRDLDFIEEAQALERLVCQYGCRQEEVARLVGLSQSAVSNKLRLLRLSPELLQMIREAGLTERHARALLRLEDERERIEVFEQIVRKNLNVANTEELVDKYLEGRPRKREEGQEQARPVYVLKDVRLFLNTLSRSVRLMQESGIDAKCGREETEDKIVLTITIPKGR